MKYLIIGGSAAGISAIEGIRTFDKTGEIILVSDETYQLYSRCLLSYYLAGVISEEKLKFKEENFFEKNKVKKFLGIKAEKVYPEEKYVLLSDGTKLNYDKLLIGTGGSAKLEEIPGKEKDGVFVLRKIDDAKKILSKLEQTKRVVVLGGGLVGLRAAYALKARNCDVSVIVKSQQILSQMLDFSSAKIIQEHLEEKGIKFYLGLSAKEIVGNGNVKGVILENGQKIDCGIVIIGKGVSPNLDLIRGTNIKTHWGIVVDENLRTNIEDIYAAGDVAETVDLSSDQPDINALWPCAVEQGRIAGINMAGGSEKYDGSLGMNSLEFYGLPVISAGITRPKGADFEELIKQDTKNKIYKKVVLRNNRIVGMILVRKIEKAGIFTTLIKKKVNVESIRAKLLDETFDFAKIIPLIKEKKEIFKEKEYQDYIFTSK